MKLSAKSEYALDAIFDLAPRQGVFVKSRRGGRAPDWII